MIRGLEEVGFWIEVGVAVVGLERGRSYRGSEGLRERSM